MTTEMKPFWTGILKINIIVFLYFTQVQGLSSFGKSKVSILHKEQVSNFYPGHYTFIKSERGKPNVASVATVS